MKKTVFLLPVSLLCSVFIHYFLFFSALKDITNKTKESASEPDKAEEVQTFYVALPPDIPEKNKKENHMGQPPKVKNKMEGPTREDEKKQVKEMETVVITSEEDEKEPEDDMKAKEEPNDDVDHIQINHDSYETDRPEIKIKNAVEKSKELKLLPVIFKRNDPEGKYICYPERELYQVLSFYHMVEMGYSNVYVELNTQEAKKRIKYFERTEFPGNRDNLIYGLLFPASVYNNMEGAINSYLQSNNLGNKASRIKEVKGEFQGSEFIVLEILMKENTGPNI